MRRIYSYIMLLVFSAFLVSISVDFTTYLKIINAGAAVEDINSVPEEHHQKPFGDVKCKTQLWLSDFQWLDTFGSDSQYFVHHQFSLQENIYFDVPYSPPDLG